MKKWIAILPTVLTLGACSSIDTAALVYVSTVKVGVQASGGTAETPGANVMIGIDVTDAAFVPVAYGRRCPASGEGAMTDCKDFPLDKLLGTSDPKFQTNDSAVTAANARVSRIGQLLPVLDRSILTTKEEIDRLENRIEQYDQAVGYLNENPFTPSEPNQLAPEPYSRALNTRDTIDRVSELASKNRAEQQLTTFTGQKTQLEQERNRLWETLSGAFGTETVTDTAMSDALSVYGSFSGDMGANTGTETGAKVSLGKSFATGVAAQRLARGAGDAATALGVAACLRQVVDIIKDKPEGAERDKLRETLARACGGS